MPVISDATLRTPLALCYRQRDAIVATNAWPGWFEVLSADERSTSDLSEEGGLRDRLRRSPELQPRERFAPVDRPGLPRLHAACWLRRFRSAQLPDLDPTARLHARRQRASRRRCARLRLRNHAEAAAGPARRRVCDPNGGRHPRLRPPSGRRAGALTLLGHYRLRPPAVPSYLRGGGRGRVARGHARRG